MKMEELVEALDDLADEAKWCANPERIEHDQEEPEHCHWVALGMMRSVNTIRRFLGLPVIITEWPKLPEPEGEVVDLVRPEGWKPMERPKRVRTQKS